MKDPPSYLTQDLRTTPFAYPTFSKRNAVGNQVITYSPSLTADLIITPIKRTKPLKKRKRKAQAVKSGDESVSDYDADVNADEMAKVEKRQASVRELSNRK